ncbi:unnamed protein product [Effrenium voratum]|nr:unnamed protein product [Effrenium voratum]|mmetsp:Transcript_65307/g.155921  ORF Transcript_65307/g.155921 Transcript_65307/m.155921 type:complete len:385 (+) Transcript_65307:58-1212(+)
MAKDAVKVLVRLLPPEITEDELVATVPEAHLQHTTWRSFQAGKRYKGEAKPSVNARCYFLFDDEENAEKFIKEYHGHQFVDGQGENFRAVACFAPYPKAPRNKTSKDSRDGTIFEDATYKEFLESLSAPRTFEAPPNPVSLIQPSSAKDTPLLNYMKTRAAERRARQDKRERERKRWHDRLGRIEEKPKWRCAECGTTKQLEEDPDARGVCYCVYCWEKWEAKESKKKKKSKKTPEYEEEEWYEEEPTKKKKKKKKGYEEEWTDDSNWYAEAGDWNEGWYEGSEEPKKKKKKKKSKDDEEEYGACHWHPEDYWEEGEGEGSKSKRRSKKQSEEQWWEEPEKESTSKRRPEGRWRAKEEVKEPQRPRRSRREKDGESQWVPKLQQ